VTFRAPNRRAVAAALLSIWAVALGAHAWRTLRVPGAQRLAEAARALPTGESWYAIYRGVERAGWVRRQLDTLPLGRGFVLSERSVRRLPELGETGRTDTDLVAWLGPGAGLDSLEFASVTGGDTTRLEAHVRGDSMIELRPGGLLRVPERPQLSGSWPLRFAADRRAQEPGRELSLLLLDPASASVRDTRLQVRESTSRVWADSADSDPDTGRWIVTGEDTVPAWRLDRVEGSVLLPVWVDVDGRVIESEEPGGLRYLRTAFELAFFGNPGEGEALP
jgi:hypothetical protein